VTVKWSSAFILEHDIFYHTCVCYTHHCILGYYAKVLRKFYGSVCNILTLVIGGKILLTRNVIVQSLNVDILRVKLWLFEVGYTIIAYKI